MEAYNVQGYFMGDTNRARHVECCSCCGHVANCAIDTAAIELDGPGFEKALSIFRTTVFMLPLLKQRSNGRVNLNGQIISAPKTIW
jgi:hypothetical protein